MSTKKAERKFYLGMSLVFLLTVFVGFSQSFYLRPLFPKNPAASYPMIYLHGTLFTSWVVLFMIQVVAVKRDLIHWHRRLGLFAGLLAVALIIQGLFLAHSAVNIGRVDDRFGGTLPLVLPIVDILLFTLFIVFGYVKRHQAQAHKRWMLLATLNMIGPAINRLPGAMILGDITPILLYTLFIIPLIFWDYKSRGKIHLVSLIGGLITIISLPARFIFSETELWQSFELWFLGLGS